MYCKRCKYDLRCSVSDRRCPECERPFDPDDGRTYLRSPSRRRIWLDRVSLILQSLGFGWLAGFLFVVTQVEFRPSPLAALAGVAIIGTVFSVVVFLPFLWFLRPRWRMWLDWRRAARQDDNRDG